MRSVVLLLFCGFSAACLAIPSAADANDITNGALTVRIEGSRIKFAKLGDQEFFNKGTTPISDFGFQIGSDIGTFVIVNNDHGAQGTVGIADASQSSDGSVVTVSGRYIRSVDVGYVRTYSIVPGTNVLRVSTTYTNNIDAAINSLVVFDTFNPEQGATSDTANKLLPLQTGSGTAKVAQAAANEGPAGLTVVAGTLDQEAHVGFHESLIGIRDGNDLNHILDHFSSPFDPDNGYANIGFSTVRIIPFDGAESHSFTVDLAFGDTPEEAREQFQNAQNRAPTADAGPDQTVECTSPAGASVTLQGSGSDPDEDELMFKWCVPDGITLDDPTSPTPSGVFPIGVTVAILTVTDGNGGVDCDEVSITVVDSHPPEVACSTDTPALFPPNHRMVEVGVFIAATDACTAPGALELVSVLVTSNEPDNGLGDGDTAGDVNGQNGYTAPVNITSAFSYDAATESFQGSVELRAERSGEGVGRSYTIEATVIDSAGNTAVTSCVVVVPHDRRKK